MPTVPRLAVVPLFALLAGPAAAQYGPVPSGVGPVSRGMSCGSAAARPGGAAATAGTRPHTGNSRVSSPMSLGKTAVTAASDSPARCWASASITSSNALNGTSSCS